MAAAASPVAAMLRPSVAQGIGEELARRLPRLLFAALDHFPLASGLDLRQVREREEAGAQAPQQPRRLVAVAVRSLSAAERLDEGLRAEVSELASGVHRPAKQMAARRVELEVPDAAGGQLQLVVNWHESVDFIKLVLKGTPSCVEALAHSGEALVFYAAEEWAALRERLVAACGSLMRPVQCKPYLKACAGTAHSLLRKAETSGRALVAAAPARLLGDLSARVAAGCAPQLTEQARVYGEAPSVSPAAWRTLLDGLAERAGAAPEMGAAVESSLEAWCAGLRSAEYRAFAAGLQGAAGRGPCGGEDVALGPLELWRDQIAAAGHRAAATPPPPRGASNNAHDHESLGLFDGLLPEGSEVVFLAQVGSFMYDLHVEASDRDYRVLFLSEAEALLSLRPPRGEFSRHVNRGFGADKRGDVEFSGQELGVFVGELARGNPRNVEILFSEKPAIRSWVWEELRAARGCFLTLRCARQYLGLVSDRLRRLGAALDDAEAFTDARAAEASKLLYHAHHKMLELGRILRGEFPVVALVGEEHERVMRLRVQRPRSPEEARFLLQEAEAERKVLSDELEAATSQARLPPEVDAAALLGWLRSVRSRSALKAAGEGRPGAPPPAPELARRHSEDDAAVRGLLAEVEAMENVRIVIAGYGVSSRTLGTEHPGSDHDVKCIFVHPRLHYFGLQPLNRTFKHKFPSAAGSADVEVSGWEAKHALQMLADHNPSVLGLLLSPRFFAGAEWAGRLREAAEASFDRRKLMIHWWRHSQRNQQEYISSCEAPLRKRYVHVLRPLLSLAWLRRQGPASRDWPPARFADLLAATVAAGAMSGAEAAAVGALLAAREELPRHMPRDGQLDLLLLRLLEDEQPPAASDWEQKCSPSSSSPWQTLCIELIRTLAPSDTEGVDRDAP